MTTSSIADPMLTFALGNLAMALPLGLVAWWLQRRATRPFLAHLLWLVVLIVLVTPPLYSLRVPSLPDAPPPVDLSFAYATGTGGTAAEIPDPGFLAGVDWQLAVVVVWLSGSLLILGWSLVRAARFDRLLNASSGPVDPAYLEIAAGAAARLGLKRLPQIRVTAARISPMVWWIGGRVRIYVPRSMMQQMNHAELGDILAHELGHVSRGDHCVRWLECLVCIVLWWNPLAWWARRNLRVCEEICCDAFVLERTEASRDAYAGALVSAMELLALPTIRPSGLASHVNGGFIERRIGMILSGQSLLETPRWLRGTVIVSAALLAPLGFTFAQNTDDEFAKAEQWIESGVNSAYLTEEQAEIMLRALRASELNLIRVLRDGEEINVTRRVVAVPGDAPVEEALSFATVHLEQRVESGELSSAEKEAILADMRTAFESGMTDGDGTVFYRGQIEAGLIDEETAARRIEVVREMEQDFNSSPATLTVRRVPANRVRVEAIPVEREAQVLDFELVREVE